MDKTTPSLVNISMPASGRLSGRKTILKRWLVLIFTNAAAIFVLLTVTRNSLALSTPWVDVSTITAQLALGCLVYIGCLMSTFRIKTKTDICPWILGQIQIPSVFLLGTCVLFALPYILFLLGISTLDFAVSVTTSGLLPVSVAAAIAVATRLMHHLLSSPQNPAASSITDKITLEDIQSDAQKLFKWLDDDREVNHPDFDLFGRTGDAARIVRRITAHPDDPPSIVLRGPHGAGKSSVGRFVKHYLEEDNDGKPKPHYRFVNIDAWAYKDSDSLAKAIVSAIVDAVTLAVPSLAIADAPNSYLRAISNDIPGLRWLSNLPSQRPDEIIDRLGRLALATNLRVVLWLDDHDRFGAQAGYPSEICSLLWLIRKTPAMCFVVTETPDGLRQGNRSPIDIKLYSYEELLAGIDHAAVIDILRVFSQRLCNDDPTMSLFLNPCKELEICTKGENAIALRYISGSIFVNHNSAMLELLTTPRVLKQTLRKVRFCWYYDEHPLRGQVPLETLVASSLVRICDVEFSDYTKKVLGAASAAELLRNERAVYNWQNRPSSDMTKTSQQGIENFDKNSATRTDVNLYKLLEIILGQRFSPDKRITPYVVPRIMKESAVNTPNDIENLGIIHSWVGPLDSPVQPTPELSEAFLTTYISSSDFRSAVLYYAHIFYPSHVIKMMYAITDYSYVSRFRAEDFGVSKDTPFNAIGRLAFSKLDRKKRASVLLSVVTRLCASELPVSLIHEIAFALGADRLHADQGEAPNLQRLLIDTIRIRTDDFAPSLVSNWLACEPVLILNWLTRARWDDNDCLNLEEWQPVFKPLIDEAADNHSLRACRLASFAILNSSPDGRLAVDEDTGEVSYKDQWQHSVDVCILLKPLLGELHHGGLRFIKKYLLQHELSDRGQSAYSQIIAKIDAELDTPDIPPVSS